jgi:hypothetical protein
MTSARKPWARRCRAASRALLGLCLLAQARPGRAGEAPAVSSIPLARTPASKSGPPDGDAPPAQGAEATGPEEPGQRDERAELWGRLLEEGTREPLAGVRVQIGERTLLTDEEGRFRAVALPAGAITLAIRGPRVRPTEIKEQLRPGTLQVVYYIPTRTTAFEAVVRAAAPRREVVETALSSQELKRIPGGQNDPIRGLQNLPGIARAPFGAGTIVVWGSAPQDTRVYADGVLIPRVYHFGALRSTISAEFVSDLSFRPGGYGADYGRGLGGVIEISTRPPRAERWHGSVTLDLIDGALTVEGPITKRLHVAAGARVSWISAFLPLITRGGSIPKLLPFYWDYQLRLRYQMSARDELDLFIFGATSDITAHVDNPDPNTRVDIASKSYFGRARLRWTRRFGKDTTLWVMPSIGGDTFKVKTGDAGLGGRSLELDVLQLGYNLRAELRQNLSAWFDFAIGLDFEGSRARVVTLAPIGAAAGESQNLPVGAGDMVRDAGRAESPYFSDSFFSDSAGPALREELRYDLLQIAPYLIARLKLLGEAVVISPQLRAEIAHLALPGVQRTLALAEPRLALRIQVVRDRLVLKAGLGIYHQAPQGAELSPRFGNPQLLWQYGATYVAGFDLTLPHGLYIEAQGFYKDLRSLVVSSPETFYSSDGLGRVYGGELLVRQPLWRGLWGFVAYTLSRSERKDREEDPWHLFRFDQTHILTLVATYQLPWGLVFGARFRYVTGNPVTPVVAGLRSADGQSYAAISGAENSVRLPDFHQLDLRVDKTFTLRRFKLGLYVEVQNVYNQENAESLVYGGRQLYQQGRVNGLPVFPNLGLRADF